MSRSADAAVGRLDRGDAARGGRRAQAAARVASRAAGAIRAPVPPRCRRSSRGAARGVHGCRLGVPTPAANSCMWVGRAGPSRCAKHAQRCCRRGDVAPRAHGDAVSGGPRPRRGLQAERDPPDDGARLQASAARRWSGSCWSASSGRCAPRRSVAGRGSRIRAARLGQLAARQSPRWSSAAASTTPRSAGSPVRARGIGQDRRAPPGG